MKMIVSIFMIVLTLYLGLVRTSFAYEVPQFTSCVNPSGQLKVNYDSGNHGIAGETGNYEGKDSVYTLSGDALTQCFCSINGSGIQTNWWKVSSLNEQEVTALKSQGWVYVPNGALWGLEEAPYLALNSNYNCQGRSTGSGGGCCSPTTDIPGPGGSGGSLAGISAGIGQVLGLASTGNLKFLYGVILVSLMSLLVSLVLKKRTRKFSRK